MDWRCGASDTALALQVQSPEFKPQSHKKEKSKNKNPNELCGIVYQSFQLLRRLR
jgi:hypothetical protein